VPTLHGVQRPMSRFEHGFAESYLIGDTIAASDYFRDDGYLLGD